MTANPKSEIRNPKPPAPGVNRWTPIEYGRFILRNKRGRSLARFCRDCGIDDRREAARCLAMAVEEAGG